LNLQKDIENKGLKVVFADQGYVGMQLLSVPVYIVQQRPKLVGSSPRQPLFQVVPRRWVIERTFGWLTHYRRLSRDYEKRIDCSKAMIQLALINILSARLARKT
jgi:transposase